MEELKDCLDSDMFTIHLGNSERGENGLIIPAAAECAGAARGSLQDIYATESLAQGEVRFRPVAQRLDAAVVADLQKSAGVAFARSPFEVVPLLSSPCDVEAMGALAIALDEMLRFARRLGTEHAADVPLRERGSALLQGDARYTESLGAHRRRAA